MTTAAPAAAGLHDTVIGGYFVIQAETDAQAVDRDPPPRPDMNAAALAKLQAVLARVWRRILQQPLPIKS